MKFMFACSLVVVSVLAVSGSSIAQEESTAEALPANEDVSEDNVSDLPSPLSEIRTNILDLERSGYFAVDEVELRTRGNGDESIVWTVRVKKAVTCRHIESLLREYRDARFYSTIKESRFDILATLVHYSDRVKLGSASNRLFRQDDVFEFWIDLPDGEFRKLLSMKAGTLILRRWRY
jgi:hypothetical protein